MNKSIGTINQIIGVVVDVEFKDKLPEIFNALEVKNPKGETVVLEVEQHLGSGVVRTIAMGATDGLARGTEVVDTGAAISVPVGEVTLGRMFNVVGEPIDNKPAVSSKKKYPIHRAAPDFKNQSQKN